MSAAFERYIGIDCSGAETCESSLKGLRSGSAGATWATVSNKYLSPSLTDHERKAAEMEGVDTRGA